ncbi:MAG: substrate-binding domain-containing protein [Treponema sp.]|nr:substrate-binding domain-containing protein [Treponema sp.]
MKRTIFALMALLIAGSAVFTGCGKQAGKMRIGVSLDTLREERWVEDYNGFLAAAEKYNVEIIIQVADQNASRQHSQVENLVTMGVKALIIAPNDAQAARQIVTLAHKEKIPVISYDRPITNGGADLLIETDQLEIGRMMGRYIWDNVPSGNLVFIKGDPGDDTIYVMAEGTMEILKPRLDDGTYKLVMEQFALGWEPADALRHMENALTANNNNIQGVIAQNDGTASGAIQALAAQGLAGKVPVTGQDCEVDAVKRIIAGTQGMTILYNNAGMADGAVQAALKIIDKQDPGITGKAEDGTPVLGYPPLEINKGNYQKLLIDSGRFAADAFN